MKDKEITWEITKIRFGSAIKYKNKILNHGDHISVSKILYINGQYARQDLIHIPIKLIDKIRALEIT